jgi:hypothetical protein
MTHVLKTLAFGKEDPKEGEVVFNRFYGSTLSFYAVTALDSLALSVTIAKQRGKYFI